MENARLSSTMSKYGSLDSICLGVMWGIGWGREGMKGITLNFVLWFIVLEG